jgi:hypothetical protein
MRRLLLALYITASITQVFGTLDGDILEYSCTTIPVSTWSAGSSADAWNLAKWDVNFWSLDFSIITSLKDLKIYFNNGGANTANIGTTSPISILGQSVGPLSPSSLS